MDDPAQDYATAPDGSSQWASVAVPAAGPPVIAEGPHTRPGWLLAWRATTEPDAP